MDLKKLIYVAIALIVIFVLVINSSILADQAVNWVKDHPKDPSAPEVLYRAGRWCNILGDGAKAMAIYDQLYQQYPEAVEYAAPAVYYSAEIRADASYNKGVRMQAIPYLDIVINQYPTTEWASKAKQLRDEVNYAH